MAAPDSRVSTVSSTPWATPTEAASEVARRLIVVVSQVSEPATLARRILALTQDPQHSVVLWGVAPGADAESALRRSLVAVEGFIAAQGRHVELRTEADRHWSERLAFECRPQDQVACYEEPDETNGWRQPLSDLLARTVHLPIRDLTELDRAVGQRPSALPVLAAWLGSIAIIAGFLILQAKIVLELQDWLQSVVLLITLIPEVGLIWFWNASLG